MSNIDSGILKILSDGSVLKAKDIAKRLGVETKHVNSALYSSLSEKVKKDSSFRWGLITQPDQFTANSNSQVTQKMELPDSNKSDDAVTISSVSGKTNIVDKAQKKLTNVVPASAGRNEPKSQFSVPIEWREGKSRTNWISEYITVGAVPSLFSPDLERDRSIKKLLSQTLILRDRNKVIKSPSQDVVALLSVAEKVLLRGDLPLVTYGVENAAVHSYGFNEEANYLADRESIIEWEWKESHARVSLETLCEKDEYAMCDELAARPSSKNALTDSEYEQRFIEMVATIDTRLPHWLTPQVPISNLVSASKLDDNIDERRVDFVFAHPSLDKALIIEIDGGDHIDSVDQQRDRLLESSGYSIIRIPNEEIENDGGAKLDQARQILNRANLDTSERIKNSRNERFTRFLINCSWAAKLQLSLVRALQFGWIKPAEDTWRIEIDSPLDHMPEAVAGLLELLNALEGLYGLNILPKRVLLYEEVDKDPTLIYEDSNQWRVSTANTSNDGEPANLRIVLEPGSSAWASYTSNPADIIVRTSFSLTRFASEHITGSQYDLKASIGFDESIQHLRTILQIIFRKEDFRQGQARAIYNALKGDDSIILLPTGGGKSIVYQLSGLITPGITLVIDPLISLIEDQVRGLSAYGIDRAIGISSAIDNIEDKKAIQIATERGEFAFILISPERMQSPDFRDTLRAISHVSRINLAVIDEAHCVSEWGHDFRPAYLNLARNIRKLEEINGITPTLLALTGTASRAVLRDMVADLELDTTKDSSIIRPDSFDRKELKFQIIETDSRNSTTDFGAIFMDLPRKFNMPKGEFFTTSGRNTCSGVVFTSFAKGPNGVFKLRDKARNVTGASTTVYSGGPPLKGINPSDWDHEKRENANRFMNNEVPLLVATKAYGMGIDKPNIRYTVHAGMPGSLEAFYQEAGRAGRDRKDALCYILFSRPSAHIEAKLDILQKSLADLHTEYKALPWGQGGDLGSALFFHLNAFAGAQDEVNDVRRMLAKFDDIEPGKIFEFPLPTGIDRKNDEKGLFRLVQVGVLSDYEIDYGRKIVRAIGGTTIPSDISDKILVYVRRSDSGRVKDVQRKLSPFITKDSNNEVIISLVNVLVSFCYDTIERARRRSIFEALEAAKNGNDPTIFRRRLLNYLQEGMDPDSFQKIVEADEIDFTECLEITKKVNNAMEAGELRGITIRFLESYPEQPALLMLRALSESLCDDCDGDVVFEAVTSLFLSAREKYSLEIVQMEKAISLLADFGETRNPIVFGPLLLAILKSSIEIENPNLNFQALAERARSSDCKEADDIILVRQLHGSIKSSKKAFDSFHPSMIELTN